jgi:hypothetical protein
MVASAVLLAACAGVILYFLVRRWMTGSVRRSHTLPPGPPGYPLVGNLLDVDTDKLHLSLAAWSQTYGDVMYLRMMQTPVVVLSSTNAIREAMTTKPFDTIFASRPGTFVGRYLFLNYSDIVLSPYNKTFVARRKLGYHLLKMYGGVGKDVERVVIRELRAFVEIMRSRHQEEFDPTEVVNDAVIDIIGALVGY